MADDINYINDSPSFDQYVDDYEIQTETNLAEKSTIDLWDEVHYHHVEKSKQPIQVTYETNDESLESLEVTEESLTLCSSSLQSIKNNIHIIGNQQSSSFDGEVQEDDEIIKHVVNEKPFPEMVEEIILDMESSLTPDFQPPSSIELQIADE